MCNKLDQVDVVIVCTTEGFLQNVKSVKTVIACMLENSDEKLAVSGRVMFF